MGASFLSLQKEGRSKATKRPRAPPNKFKQASTMKVLIHMLIILISSIEARYCCGSSVQYREKCTAESLTTKYETIIGTATWSSSNIRTVSAGSYQYCRCSHPNYSVGISICHSGPYCDWSYTTPCYPTNGYGNTMTYEQCKYQCERVGMILPESDPAIRAAEGTGCGTNNYWMWVNRNVQETETCPDYTRASDDCSDCINDSRSCSTTQYLNVNGFCTNCAAYHRASSDQRSCTQDKCGTNDIWTSEGYCQTCSRYYRPDSSKTKCINDGSSCSSTQFLNDQGYCTECPRNYRASSDQLSCINDASSCSATQILNSQGYCVDCASTYRASSDQLTCINDKSSCTSTQYLNSTGYCIDCPANYRSNSARTLCYNDFWSCSETQILDASGYCTDCPANYRASSDKLTCINDARSCSATQILNATGYCIDCATTYRASRDQLTCINDKSICTSTQQLTFNGFCADCPDNHRSNSERTQCYNDLAQCSSTQILDSNGYCINCPTNYRGNSDKTTCINDKANCNATQILTNDGYCQSCSNFFRANNDKTVCINDMSTCSDIQILTSQGYCTNCPANFRGNSDMTQCMNDQASCTATQILDPKGKCSDCPNLYRSDTTQLTCINDLASCSATEILDRSGYCTPCNNFFRANNDKTTCINDFDTCSSSQIMTSDGYCTNCATQSRANTFKTQCVNDAAQCPAIVILDETGHCTVTCEQTKRASDDRTACIDDSATCLDNYIIDGMGFCKIECRLDTIADDTHRKCVDAPVENDDSYYGDYTFDYVDNGGTYYDTYCECEMSYAYLSQYGTPSYYDDTDSGDSTPEVYENTYTTPSGEQVYFGMYGTYTPSYQTQYRFNFENFKYNAQVDYTKPYTDTMAKNNHVDLTKVVFEKQFEAGNSQDSDYMWLTNPSCDGLNFVANYRDGTQYDYYAFKANQSLPGPYYREWHKNFYDPRAPEVCQNIDSVTDMFGETCTGYYDSNSRNCGYYDDTRNGFTASALCCACGGGYQADGSRLQDKIARQDIIIPQEQTEAIMQFPPKVATEYAQPVFSIQYRELLQNSTYTYSNEHYYLQCEAGKIAYFGIINRTDNSLNKNQPFSQIVADGRSIYCGTNTFGDPLPGATKYCFCETVENYYGTPTPDPATRFIFIDELMVEAQGFTKTGLAEKIQTFLESQQVDMAFLINGYVEGKRLSGQFNPDGGEREGDALLQVNENYPIYYQGYRQGVEAIVHFATPTTTGTFEMNYVKYSDDDGQVESIYMPNGDVWYAHNFFSQPFEYQMVDCANNGSESTTTYRDKLTPLLFEGVGHSTECWFTSCDGSNYYFNCYDEQKSSFRAKAVLNDFGDVVNLELDTDQFFMFQNKGRMSSIRVVYDRNYQPTGLTWTYTDTTTNQDRIINMQVTSSFKNNENPKDVSCSTSPRDYNNATYFDMQWAVELVNQTQSQQTSDQGGSDCVDDNSISDAYGQTCTSLYNANPQYCGQLDTPTYSAASACCACRADQSDGESSGGGDSSDTTDTDQTDCSNDDSVRDAYGQTCSGLYDANPQYCGQLDSPTFTAASLCCACGGGKSGGGSTTTPDEPVCQNDDSLSDAYGQTCSTLYDLYPEYCGQLDTPTFSASSLCCACGRVEEPPKEEEPACQNDDSLTDAYGQTCTSLYDANPMYCGQLDTPTFSASSLCCACGRVEEPPVKEEPVCQNDDSLTDAYGQTCTSLYDANPMYCGQLDSPTFSASSLCCACGGGIMTAKSAILSSQSAASASLIPGCYDRDNNPIPNQLCKCHASCSSCIALDNGQSVSTGPMDCIDCADPRYTLNPYWTDGTGSCDITADNTDYTYDYSNGGGSYYDSADYSTPPPYECECPSEFDFFTWMTDFFAWLASLFNFLG